MRVFISGGCKNGKSTHAQDIAVLQKHSAHPLYYLATMVPHDDEDLARIARHIEERRGMGFETLEIPFDIHTLTEKCVPESSLLLDSTTALLANEMFRGGTVNSNAYEKIQHGLAEVFQKFEHIVVVSDYIYGDGVDYDPLTADYLRGLAKLDRFCAQTCDVVLEACAGNFIVHKGGSFYEALW